MENKDRQHEIEDVTRIVLRPLASPLPLAFGIEDVQHKTVLPLGRRGEAAEAFEGDLSQQVGPVGSEAGVHKQL